MKLTLRYFTSFILFLVVCSIGFSQTQQEALQDTVAIEQSYGLRLGGDMGKLIRSFLDDEYSGFEIQGDYRLTQDLYIAGELGTEEKTTLTPFLNVTTSGSYFKAGVDYNFYQNWLTMDNMIYAGLRVGVSTFNHDLNEYTIYVTDQYYEAPVNITETVEFDGLTALWAELIIGIKAEVLKNLYMGLNIQFKGLITEDEPSNFENLYIPGFNRTYDSGRIGFGYGYTLAYRIPIYKKKK